MVFIEFFGKKSWTIVYGFHQSFEEITDYSPWFSLNFLKKSLTIVHGFQALNFLKKLWTKIFKHMLS